VAGRNEKKDGRQESGEYAERHEVF